MDRESELALEEDEPAVVTFLVRNGGSLERDKDNKARYWLTMGPRSASDERYYVCVTWSRYPHSAPSVKFADAVGGSLAVTKAWPVITGYRPGNFDICKPFTAEGYVAHSEWASGPEAWPATGNPFLWVAETLQGDLDHRYGGRSA
jgi:hypothetical protein